VIRVLLAEDQLMFRTAVRSLLELEGDIQVVAEVAQGDELVAAALAARPDVAVVDIEMPGQDGISAASALRQSLPSCRTLILTMYGRPGFVQRALEGGISSFVLKDAPVEVLVAGNSSVRRRGGRCRPGPRGTGAQGWTGPALRAGARDPRRVRRGPMYGRVGNALVAVRGHRTQPRV